MIDPQKENLIRLNKAAKRIPGNPSLCALHRWRKDGVRGARLETVLIGGARFTSAEAIERFIAAQNEDQFVAAQNEDQFVAAQNEDQFVAAQNQDQAETRAVIQAQRKRQASVANRILEEEGM